MNHESPVTKFAERFLTGAVESIARAGAKFVESLASDAQKALKLEAAKAELLENGVKFWRKTTLGEVDDLPASLQDDVIDNSTGSNSSNSKQENAK